MLLSYKALVSFVDQGCLSLVQKDHINAASIDLILGNEILREDPSLAALRGLPYIDLAAKESISTTSQRYDDGEAIRLNPGEFILAATKNVFNLPNNFSAEYSLKSSLARNGLAHLLAGWIDAGFNQSVLTLEIHNVCRHHGLVIRPGMLIGQIKVFAHETVPQNKAYGARGRYNGDASVQAAKPDPVKVDDTGAGQ